MDSEKKEPAKKNIKISSSGKLAIIILVCLVLFSFVLAISYAVRTAKEEEEICRSGYCETEDKPMIYLYPQTKTEVTVKLGNPQRLTTTYPEYNSGWKVTAEPNGKLLGQDGREYYGLYWEGKNVFYRENNEGFVVKGEDAAQFLEEKLAILGLTEREAEEFIVYWLPKMEHNEYNYVRFASDLEIALDMPMEVSPKPDTVIRIMMITKKLDEPKTVKEQKLTPVERKGFTVVEWGGVNLGL